MEKMTWRLFLLVEKRNDVESILQCDSMLTDDIKASTLHYYAYFM